MKIAGIKPGMPVRLRAYTFDAVLAEAYPISFAVMPDTSGAVVEIAIRPTGTIGRSGHGLELMFEDLGIGLSRAIQGRDPANGTVAGAVPSCFDLVLRRGEHAEPLAMRCALRRDSMLGTVNGVVIGLADPDAAAGLQRIFADLTEAVTRSINDIWNAYGPVRRTLKQHGVIA